MAEEEKVVPISKSRHWKQKWNPNAEFVYRRSLKIGDGRGNYRTVCVGDDVDKELWGLAKLKRLWESGAIEIKGWKAPEPPVTESREETKLTGPREETPENEVSTLPTRRGGRRG